MKPVARDHAAKPTSSTLAELLSGAAVALLFATGGAWSAEDGDIPFVISVDGEPIDEGIKPTAEDLIIKTDADLARVDIQVKFDGLDAKPLLNVSTMPVRRSYHAGEEVTFLATSNYPAFIDRSEIRIYGADTTTPVAIVPVRINGRTAWRMPAQVDEGQELSYVLRVYDDQGRYDETVPLTFEQTVRDYAPEAGRQAVAPGMGEDRTASRNIPLSGGAVTVFGRNVPADHRVNALGEDVPLDEERSFVMQRILPPGGHRVDVVVEGLSKASALSFNRQINIPDDDWFYVALADLTVGKRMGDVGIETVRPGEYDDIYTNGRLAFYVKGKIKGEYLLTAAGDTGEDKIENMFRGLDSKDPRQLLRRLDPDDYYPVYGDDSTMIEDAPTRGKFFIRLERGDDHVMWGNYKTRITGTEFMHSDRTLYGASAVHRSEDTTSFGERKAEVTLYAALPDTLPQRDEFLGTGGSAYFMKRQDITVGSETATVEVRNAVSGRVVERRTLVYGEDYSFDYMQGVMILKRPLSSSTGTSGPVRDGALGGNRIYLVVQYEFTPLATDIDGYVYGGRSQQWLNDNVRIGLTAMSETTGEADQRAYGADIQVRHSERTFLEAEVSRSHGPGFGISRSYDGGLTISDVNGRGDRNRVADAWRVRGQIDLEDIAKGGVKGTVGGYYEEKQSGFATLSEQIGVGQRIWGAHADLELTKRTGFNLVYDSFSDDEDKIERQGKASVSYQLDEAWKASFGIGYTKAISPRAIAAGKRGYDGSRLDAGVRLEYEPNDDWKAYVFGQGTLGRTGDIRGNDRAGVGGEAKLTDRIGVAGELSYGNGGVGALAAVTYDQTADTHYYLSYRLDPDRAFDNDRSYDLVGTDRGAIVIGGRRKLGQSTSAYAENSYDMFGKRQSLTQTYGIVYTPDVVWTVDTGLEVGTIRDDTRDPATGAERPDFDRKAASLSIGYNDEEAGITARVRGEARFERSDDDTRDATSYLFASGLSWQTSKDWRLHVNVDAVISESNGGSFNDREYVEASVGYAYRPTSNDKLNALFKYTWLYDMPGRDQVGVNGSLASPRQRSHILSADLIYDPLPWLSVGGKYGFRIGKVQQRTAEGFQSFTDWEQSSAHLGILRADLHFVKEWDLLLEGRVLHMPSADTTDLGALAAVYRHVGENFKIGIGYNFGRFSDDLGDLTFDDRGVFLNLVGKF